MLFWTLLALVLIFGFVVFRGAPYVPSHRSDVRRAFGELYKVGKEDTVVDIGSGDGVILRMASRRGARAVGYELNPILVGISRLLSRGDKKVKVYLADFWFAKIPKETTLVYVFAVERDVKKLAAKLQGEANRLGRSFYCISYGSELGDKKMEKMVGAHHLYLFRPLQDKKP